MICCSIQNRTFEEIGQLLFQVEMAEIRLDLCELSDEQIEELFSSDTPLIATCRATAEAAAPVGNNAAMEASGQLDYHRTERLLTLAIKAGARYVDLEIEAPKPVSKRLARACAEWGTVMIRSYHNFVGTPSIDELREIVDRCRHHDGEVVKIVTTARSEADVAIVESLYKYYTPESLVAFVMSDDAALSAESRLGCLSKGAPFSYAAASAAEATAPGQMVYDDMCARVYGERGSLNAGPLRVPASKSFAQRAVIAAALADGKSVLRGFSDCGDSCAALALAESLGAKVTRLQSLEAAGAETDKFAVNDVYDIEIEGIAAYPGCVAPSSVNVGESGLLTRLMLPLTCVLSGGEVGIDGRGTLLKRPLQGAKSTVEALGGSVDGEMVPLTVCGPLKPGKITVDGSKSSQLVSGALMALPLCDRNSTLSVQKPTSIPYIYITMDILRKFGVKVRSEMYGGRQLLDEDWSKCTEILLKIKENQRYKAAEIDIEGDWSAATVFLAAGAVFGRVELEGLDTSSLQADLTMLDLLMDAGASVSQMDAPKGKIAVQKAPLRAVKEDLSNSPDLFPVVAVFCAFCQGRSRLKGVRRLLHKESNRAEGILNMLRQLGVKAGISEDSMVIEGESLDSRIMNGRLLKGGRYTSSSDHRMVMALRLAELGADGPIEVDDTACVAKSFPEFNEIWKSID